MRVVYPVRPERPGTLYGTVPRPNMQRLATGATTSHIENMNDIPPPPTLSSRGFTIVL